MKRSRMFPRDGYTVRGYLKDEPGMYDEPLRFEFRPMPVQRVSQLLAELNKQGPATYDRFCAKEVAERLVSWDITDDTGEQVEISTANILLLHPRLFNRLFNVILGQSPLDPDPDASDDEDSLDIRQQARDDEGN